MENIRQSASENMTKAGRKQPLVPRDRIILLGRRSSGKTVYLAVMYEQLWKSKSEFSVKATHGINHAEYIRIAADLRDGKWPAATQSISRSQLEITYKHHKRTLVALDYPGELFTRAFVKDSKSEAVDELLKNVDRAAAIIFLVDPEHAAGEDIDAAIDNDFGIVQAMTRVLNRVGGRQIPIVLALTKNDITNPLIEKFGGAAGFVRNNFPRLLSMVNNLIICRVSAVQTRPGPDGRNLPKEDFEPKNLLEPLRYCLERMARNQKAAQIIRQRNEYIQIVTKQIEHTRKRDRTILVALWAVVIAVIFIIAIVFLSLKQ